MKPSASLLSALTLGAAFATLPGTAGAVRPPTLPARPLMQVNQCQDLRSRILDAAAHTAVNIRYGGYYYLRGGLEDGRAMPAAEGKSAAGPSHHTTTNNQERGVDEADVVQTDGKYIYTVSGNQIVIARSWPARQLAVVSRLALGKDVSPAQLLLRGDRLIVFGGVWQTPASQRTIPVEGIRRPDPVQWEDPRASFYGTRIAVVDISDRAAPRILHQADIEGSMVQARLIGDDVYLASNASAMVPARVMKDALAYTDGMPKSTGYGATEAVREKAFAVLRAHLEVEFRRLSLADTMPRMRSGARGGLRSMYSCQDVHIPSSGSDLGVLTLSHFDVDAPAAIDNVGLVASGWQFYASTGSVYVASPEWDTRYFWRFTGELAQPNATLVHKFALDRGGKPRYAASGRVRGHLLNQFSMSEHEGYLRLATTDQVAWNDPAQVAARSNHLTVMAQRGRRLVAVGKLSGLAKNEQIYSARMDGDTGYMVTFRQTDPLFTLDLSDPRQPRVSGELKINGFSSYIHRLGDDRLLTIGQDADDQGRTLGAHLQIFDVNDPAHPRRLFHERLGDDGEYAWSQAQWDHHAFTYDPVTRTLAIPLQLHGNGDWRQAFMGVLLYEIDDDEGFIAKGRISHAGMVGKGDDGSAFWSSQIQRTIIMDRIVYTLSTLGLQANRLDAPARAVGAAILALRF